MAEHGAMAEAIINQIISMQTPDDQRAILGSLFKRYALPDREEYTILTDQVVAEKYGVHIRTVQDWLLSGQLNGFKEARKWYTRTDWLRSFEDIKAGNNERVTRMATR